MFDYRINGATIVDGTGAEPVTGDIAIEDGRIAAVGRVEGRARETIDADGAHATPGWIDVHTHFDGQVSWDDTMDPSFSHGVTSIVMGNCGVGFAPCPPGHEKQMIELMEGVEDIPGTALYEGIEWGNWETFPEYIDYLGTRNFSLDVGTQIPHSALRYYVMGDCALQHEDANEQDLRTMTQLVTEGMRAGALGFSTSRTIGHRSVGGEPIPGTFAEKAELIAIAKAMGKGVFQAVPAGVVGDIAGPEKWTTEQEVELFAEIARASGRPCTFTLAQNGNRPDQWRHCLDIVERANAEGLSITPQIATRPIGFVTSLKSYHMFSRRKTYLQLEHLPHEQLLAQMRKPEIKAAILADADVPPDQPGVMAGVYGLLAMAAPAMFPIEMPIDYEPEASASIGARAAAEGRDVAEYMYDFLTAGDGDRFAILLGANFVDGTFSVMEEMIPHPNTTIGLSDAGAHVNLIFDAVGPTYQLTHWVRDRTRGDRFPIELMVHKQTQTNAELFGLTDRGTLEVGKRADLNLIDLERLALGPLEVHRDLPAGGSRILQGAQGYIGTFVNGVRTREHDRDTGARPGTVIRALAVGAAYHASPDLRAAVPADRLDRLVPVFILTELPAGARGVLFAALLAAAMSSLDSALNSLSASTMRDFIEPHVRTGSKADQDRAMLRWSKITTVAWGVAMTCFAFFVGGISKTVVEGINKLGAFFYGPILAGFLAGILDRRSRGPAMIAGVVAGVGANVVLWLRFDDLFWMWWNVSGLVVAVLVTVVVSRLMTPPRPEQLEGTTLTWGGILERERQWVTPYVVLLGYFVAILLVALYSDELVTSLL